MLDSDLYFDRNSVPSLLWHFSINSFPFHVVLSKNHLKTISTQFPEMLATGISWVAPTDAPNERQELFIHAGGRLRQRSKHRLTTWSWLINWSASWLRPHRKDFTQPDLPGDFKEVKPEQCLSKVTSRYIKKSVYLCTRCRATASAQLLFASSDLAPRCHLHTVTWPQGVTCIQWPGSQADPAWNNALCWKTEKKLEAEAHTLGRLFLHPIHRVFGTVASPSVHQRCLHRNNVRLSQNMTRTRITFTSVTSAAVCMLFAARLNRIEKKRAKRRFDFLWHSQSQNVLLLLQRHTLFNDAICLVQHWGTCHQTNICNSKPSSTGATLVNFGWASFKTINFLPCQAAYFRFSHCWCTVLGTYRHHRDSTPYLPTHYWCTGHAQAVSRLPPPSLPTQYWCTGHIQAVSRLPPPYPHSTGVLGILGDSDGVVNSLDFCPASLKSLGCFYFRCILSSQW